MKRTMQRRASSLVELLVVVAIIAILGAALIPSLRRSLIMARNTVCMHNIHMIGQSLAQYRYDNDGWLPTEGATPAADPDSENNGVWFVKLYPSYLPDPVVLTCPEDPYRSRMARVRDIRTERDVANFASYGINSFIVTSGNGFLADLDRRWPTRPLDIILAADMGPDRVQTPSQTNETGSVPDRNAGLLAWDDGFDPVMPDQLISPWVTNRHGGTINMLTIDGSVRRPKVNRALTAPIQRYYEDCAAGGCTLCRELHLYHYSFAQDRLYWWTGPAPVE